MITHAKSRFISGPISPPARRLLVGIIHGPGGVEHVAAAASRLTLIKELALWAALQAREKLPKPESDNVENLVREGRFGPAIRRYIALIRRRWDPVSLSIEHVEIAGDDPVDIALMLDPDRAG